MSTSTCCRLIHNGNININMYLYDIRNYLSNPAFFDGLVAKVYGCARVFFLREMLWFTN
jgi:hypothetical protein